jgi:hypothetical protein
MVSRGCIWNSLAVNGRYELPEEGEGMVRLRSLCELLLCMSRAADLECRLDGALDWSASVLACLSLPGAVASETLALQSDRRTPN